MFKRIVLISVATILLCVSPFSAAQKPPAKQLHVTSVKLTLDSAFQNYKGACPVIILFNGDITANAKGTVRYTYQKSTGGASPQYALTFGGPGTREVRVLRWRIVRSTSGWAALKPLPPHGYISSTRAFFHVTCTGHLTK